jgi:enoyl-CoA hydratase/carnithine racemase
MLDEFEYLWKWIGVTDDIHCCVLRAAPGKAWSTGADVKAAQVGGPPMVDLDNIWHCEDPGKFLGPKSFFDPHVTYGMTSALEPIGMTYKLPLQDVLRMVLLGNDERIGAGTALRIGLVSEIVALDTLWPRAHELATTIAAKPPAATAGSLKAIWQSLDLPRSIALQNGLKYCQIGNPVGIPQVDRTALMADKAKKFTIR